MARESAASDTGKRALAEREPGTSKKRATDTSADGNKLLMAAVAGALFGAVATYAYVSGNYRLVPQDKYDALLRGAPALADPAAQQRPAPAPLDGPQRMPGMPDRGPQPSGEDRAGGSHPPPAGKFIGEVEQFDLAGSPSKGPDKAKVTLVEFSDFQCPACAQMAPSIDRIRRERPDKVRVVFKHLPLPTHDHSRSAAYAAEAAAKQNKFWDMADLLFRNQNHLERDDLLKYAGQLGLNVDKFKADMDDQTVRDRVERDFTEATRAIAQSERPGAPAFFLNGRRADVNGYEQLALLVDSL